MSRTLTPNFIMKLKEGDFKHILACVNNDSELSLELRLSSVAVVYYKKSKILSIHSRKKEPVLLSNGYYKNHPIPVIDINNPHKYFETAKSLVDAHVGVKKNIEFSIQQKILSDNNSIQNRFLVVDMEYQFEQRNINQRTSKNTRFDLVAIDLLLNKIVLLELKQGFASSKGTSGVNDHIKKYDEHVAHNDFKTKLFADIKNIVRQKELLGIYKFSTSKIIDNLNEDCIDFKVIFAYNTKDEMKLYKQKYKNDETIFLDIASVTYVLNEYAYKDKQRKFQTSKLLYKYPALFNGDKGGGNFEKYKGLAFVLADGINNLFWGIVDDVIVYFKENDIAWWGDNKKYPTGHLLSSQIQCLNFLFALRKDKDALLKLAQLFDNAIDDVLPTINDINSSFIAFEFAYKNEKLLGENDFAAKRGFMCTSIDVFIVAKKKNTIILIPIEWKFTESYPEAKNKALENGKGQTRQKRYNHLIENSKQLKSLPDLENSVYYYEPFYEFMRQTLLVEQMVMKGIANDFLHIAVIPSANKELLGNNYCFSKYDLQTTWRDCINFQDKFKIVDSNQILNVIENLPNYSELLSYLKQRYY